MRLLIGSINPRRKSGLTFFFLLLPWALFSQSVEPTGLAVGDVAPSFSAVDHQGVRVDLSQTLNNGPVVLMFYRGVWCPYCNRQLKQMQDSISFINQKGGTVIAVTPESVEQIQKTSKKSKASFHIVHDQDLKIMEDYKVSYELEDATLQRYLRSGIDLQAYNGENGANLPVPATFVIGQDGKIVFAFFDPDYTKRATIQSILQHL